MTHADTKEGWILTDYFYPSGMAESDESISIDSEAQLRATLEAYSQREERLVVLESPTGLTLGIGIGGPFGTIEFRETPNTEIPKLALPSQRYADGERYFSCHGLTVKAESAFLIPRDAVIDIVTDVFQSGKPSNKVQWVDWLEWMKKEGRVTDCGPQPPTS